MLTVLVRGQARKVVPTAMRRMLRRKLERALRAAAAGDAELCLSLTDDQEIQSLNHSYAGEDHVTDVLSFSQQEGVPLAAGVLGDVVISVETAERQALGAGHGLLQELLHLSVHGLVHLLGYDHATAEEEQRMFGYEALLRAQALGTRAVQELPRPPK